MASKYQEDIEIKSEQLNNLGFTKIRLPRLGKSMIVEYQGEIFLFSFFKNDLGGSGKRWFDYKRRCNIGIFSILIVGGKQMISIIPNNGNKWADFWRYKTLTGYLGE